MSTQLSTVTKKCSSLNSRIFGLVGALIIVSGATLLFAPSQALASTYVQAGCTIQPDGHVGSCVNIPNSGDFYGFAFGTGHDTAGVTATWFRNSTNTIGGIVNATGYYSGFNFYGTAEGGFLNGTFTTNDGSYWIEFTKTGSPYVGDWTGTIYYQNVTRSGGVWSDSDAIPPDTSTHIETVTPADKSTNATSTAFTLGFTGYLNSDDLNSGSKVTLDLQNSAQSFTQCADVICSQFASNAVIKSYTLNLSSSGSFSFSTTTSMLKIGRYYMKVTIKKDKYSLFGFSFWSTDLVATSTTFILATTTNVDKIKENVSNEIDQLTNVANNPDFLAKCSISNFGFYECLTDIAVFFFVPDSGSLDRTFNALKAGMFSHVPFGYITRTIDILNGTSTTTLPSLAYTFPNDFVVADFRNTTLDLTPWKYFYNGSSTVISDIKSNGTDHKDVWQIFQPLISAIVYLTLLFMIIKDLTHIHPNHHKKL